MTKPKYYPGFPFWSPGRPTLYTRMASASELLLIFFNLATPDHQTCLARAPTSYQSLRSEAISSNTSPSSPRFPRICTPHSPYPVGSGSVAIRRTMLPKSRRVRWLSANSSQ